MQKEITLLIPTYNRDELLDNCLNSVSKQTFKGSIHCVIMNNNSTDGTNDVIRNWINKAEFKITPIDNKENLDPIENWKSGLKYMDTEYSKWLQDDDWLEPEAIETMVQDIYDYKPNGLIYNCNIYSKNNDYQPIYNYYKHSTKKITRNDVVNHVLQLAPVFPVSPTASIFKSEYIKKAINYGVNNKICTKKLMGNDLIMNFFGVFNDLDTYYINKTLVNFYGGDDSISLVNNPKILSHCYLRSLCLMINFDSTSITEKQKKIIEHRQFATKLRGLFDSEYKEISTITNFKSKLSVDQLLKYLQKIITR